jgi:hypothetical protein
MTWIVVTILLLIASAVLIAGVARAIFMPRFDPTLHEHHRSVMQGHKTINEVRDEENDFDDNPR